MKLTNAILCISLAAAALTACEQQTPDGKIPDKYVPEAQKLVGDYKGSIDGSASGVLSIRLNGSQVVAKFSKPLLDCGGKIGQLESVDASSKSVDAATFALAGASCVDGNQVVFRISQDQRTLTASILESTTTETRCPSQSEIDSCEATWSGRDADCDKEDDNLQRQMCYDQNKSGAAGCSSCDDVATKNYLSGSFRR